MWDPRRLTTLWASAAFYRDEFGIIIWKYFGVYFHWNSLFLIAAFAVWSPTYLFELSARWFLLLLMVFSTYCGVNSRCDISNSCKVLCVCAYACQGLFASMLHLTPILHTNLPPLPLICHSAQWDVSNRDHVALDIVYFFFLYGFKYGSWDSSVNIALGYGLDGRSSIIQPPIQWVLGVLSPGVKWSRCKADHSPPSSVEELRSAGAIPPLPCTSSWHGTQLIKHRDNMVSNIQETTH
jgi:hypothetical protein